MNHRSGMAVLLLSLLAACSTGGLDASGDGVFAPAVDPRGDAVDGLVVGHRLMAAQEFELALDSYTRAAGERGLDAEVLSALGSANLQLGRLHQAEDLLRDAVEKEPDWPEAWNNLGVVLMERAKHAEATEVFRRAYALDNGRNDAIRDNLRLALAKRDQTRYDPENPGEYRLVRKGAASYVVRRADG